MPRVIKIESIVNKPTGGGAKKAGLVDRTTSHGSVPIKLLCRAPCSMKLNLK